MLRRGLPVVKYEMSEYWLDIGQISDYRKVDEIYEKHFKETGA
jgi:NDP-sugar pyrophosphorylase family protein